VREGFLLFVSLREISFTAYSSSKITQTYLRLSSTKILLNTPRNAPRFLCQKSVQLYSCPNNECCTECLDSCANIFAKTVRNMQQEQLKIHACSPRKLCPKLDCTTLKIRAKSVRTVHNFTHKLMPTDASISVQVNACMEALECIPTSSKL